MASELQWMLLRNSNSFLVRRDGIAFSREPSNPARMHCYKYCGLAQPKAVSVTAVPEGVVVARRSTKVPANKVADRTKVYVIKKGADAGVRAAKVGRDLQASGYRLDIARAVQARVSAYLLAAKTRKAAKKTSRVAKN